MDIHYYTQIFRTLLLVNLSSICFFFSELLLYTTRCNNIQKNKQQQQSIQSIMCCSRFDFIVLDYNKIFVFKIGNEGVFFYIFNKMISNLIVEWKKLL